MHALLYALLSACRFFVVCHPFTFSRVGAAHAVFTAVRSFYFLYRGALPGLLGALARMMCAAFCAVELPAQAQANRSGKIQTCTALCACVFLFLSHPKLRSSSFFLALFFVVRLRASSRESCVCKTAPSGVCIYFPSGAA